jgi:hypothetical protein
MYARVYVVVLVVVVVKYTSEYVLECFKLFLLLCLHANPIRAAVRSFRGVSTAVHETLLEDTVLFRVKCQSVVGSLYSFCVW